MGLLLGLAIGYFIWGRSAAPSSAPQQEQVSEDRSAANSDLRDIEQQYQDYQYRLGKINEPVDSLLSEVYEWLQTEPASEFDLAHKEADRLSAQYNELRIAWQALKQGQVENLNKILQDKDCHLSDSQKTILNEFVRVNGKKPKDFLKKAKQASSFDGLLPQRSRDNHNGAGAH